MATTKAHKGDDLDAAILVYLNKIPFSTTTEMVGKTLNIAWYTAQMHLFKLKEDGKIKYFKIGRQNQWIIASRLKT
jgi:hypothetical protein